MAQKVAGNIVIRFSTDSGADKFSQDMRKAADATRNFGGLMRTMGTDAQRGTIQMRTLSREAGEFAGIMLLGAKAITTQATATGLLEAAVNRLRAARVGLAAATGGLTGALVAGTEIAAVVAIERIAESAYRRAKEIEATSLAAQKRGFSYEDTSALQFAAQRISKPPDYFDSAVKSAGGVKQLADRLKELAEINDPLLRADAAFKLFGADAEKVLENVGTRFGENIQRAQEWGFTLDQVSRERIVNFNRDITALKGTFDSLSDSVAASKQTLVSLLQVDFASIYAITKAIATDEGGRTAYKQLFTEPDPKDAIKGAQSSIQQRQSADMLASAQKEMLASLAAPAEKSFTKDYFARDQEADLKAEIASLQKRLFVSDRTSPDFGKLTSGASYPGGYGAEAEDVQKYSSDEGRLARVLEAKKAIKDADEAAKKAAAELAAAERSVAASLQAAQLSELSGADKLRAQREIAIGQYGKTKQLIADITKTYEIQFALEGKALIAASDVDMKARAAAEARSQQALLAARTKYTSDAVLNTINTSAEAPGKRDEVATQGADITRESQLRQLESFNAKTLSQKVAVENAKAQIETDYFLRVQAIEEQGIDRGYQKQLQAQKVLLDAKLISQKAYDDQAAALETNEQLDMQRLHERTDAEIQKSGIATAKAIREAYQQEFQKIQQAMDQVLSRISDQLANLVTGQKTSFGKMFLDMGHQVTSNVIKNGLTTLLTPLERRVVAGPGGAGLPGTGQVGDLAPNGDTIAGVGAPQRQGGFAGILSALFGGHGKKDGSSASEAFWVRLADASGSPIQNTGGPGSVTGASKRGSVLFGNGGLLGTGGVPTVGEQSGDQSSSGDSLPKQFDQYGFRIRPDSSAGAGTPDVSSDVNYDMSDDSYNPSGGAASPFVSLPSLGGNGAITFGKNQKKAWKPPAWMKWVKLGVDVATGVASGNFQSALGDINSDVAGGGGGTPDVSSNINYDTSDDSGDDGGGDGDFGGGLATGGPVRTGKHYLVGERGPELFRSATAGHIIDHETTKRMARAGMLTRGASLPTAAPRRLAPRADGGDVSAGESYLVGERGAEAFMPNLAADQGSRRTEGNGGGNAYYTIDARGTDPNLVEQRVRQALVQVHKSAITTSVQASVERSKRTPQ